MILEATPAAPPPVNPPTEPQLQDSSPSLELSSTQVQTLPQPTATSSPQQENHSQARDPPTALEPSQESGPMLYLSESLTESMPTDDGEVKPPQETGGEITTGLPEPCQTGASPDSQAQETEARPGDVVLDQPLAPASVGVDVAGIQPVPRVPPKPKRDRLARLRELGLDPPLVPKLSAGDGAFIHLEPPPLNPGERRYI